MKNLLVCIDGSRYGQVVCRYAAWLAQESEATIELLYVTDLRQFEVPAIGDLSGSLGIQPFEGMITHLQEVEKVKAKFIGEQAMQVFSAAGLSNHTSFKHETGLLVDVIKDYSSEVDLILLGKRGENAGFASEHLGSMLERVVRSARVPCFVGNRDYREPSKIAIAHDGGDSCQKALDYICMLAPIFRVRQVHVLTCVEGHNEDLASDRLADAEEQLGSVGIHPNCEMLSGVVEHAIANYVTDAGIDLLVLGAYGHSRIRELLIGSTTTELIRSCHVPVLCFR